MTTSDLPHSPPWPTLTTAYLPMTADAAALAIHPWRHLTLRARRVDLAAAARGARLFVFAEGLGPEAYRDRLTPCHGQLWAYAEPWYPTFAERAEARLVLEDAGLRPVPIYAPLRDGWAAFDALAERYGRIVLWGLDRISDREARRSLLATTWVRAQAHARLRLHVHGLAPTEWLTALPMASYSIPRGADLVDRAAGRSLGHLPAGGALLTAYLTGAHARNQDSAAWGLSSTVLVPTEAPV